MGKIRDYIKYSLRELESYTKANGSCVNKVNASTHLEFPPYGLTNFKDTLLHTISNKKIGFFDHELKGIILDIRNIKILGDIGAIRFDSPGVHVNIQAQFYIFQPHVGAVVKGIVKHVSLRQLGVIIYRVFSVKIKLQVDVGPEIAINSEIEFRIKDFDLQDFIPFIEGELTTSCQNETALAAIDQDDSGVAEDDDVQEHWPQGARCASSSSDNDSDNGNLAKWRKTSSFLTSTQNPLKSVLEQEKPQNGIERYANNFQQSSDELEACVSIVKMETLVNNVQSCDPIETLSNGKIPNSLKHHLKHKKSKSSPGKVAKSGHNTRDSHSRSDTDDEDTKEYKIEEITIEKPEIGYADPYKDFMRSNDHLPRKQKSTNIDMIDNGTNTIGDQNSDVSGLSHISPSSVEPKESLSRKKKSNSNTNKNANLSNENDEGCLDSNVYQLKKRKDKKKENTTLLELTTSSDIRESSLIKKIKKSKTNANAESKESSDATVIFSTEVHVFSDEEPVASNKSHNHKINNELDMSNKEHENPVLENLETTPEIHTDSLMDFIESVKAEKIETDADEPNERTSYSSKKKSRKDSTKLNSSFLSNLNVEKGNKNLNIQIKRERKLSEMDQSILNVLHNIKREKQQSESDASQSDTNKTSLNLHKNSRGKQPVDSKFNSGSCADKTHKFKTPAIKVSDSKHERSTASKSDDTLINTLKEEENQMLSDHDQSQSMPSSEVYTKTKKKKTVCSEMSSSTLDVFIPIRKEKLGAKYKHVNISVGVESNKHNILDTVSCDEITGISKRKKKDAVDHRNVEPIMVICEERLEESSSGIKRKKLSVDENTSEDISSGVSLKIKKEKLSPFKPDICERQSENLLDDTLCAKNNRMSNISTFSTPNLCSTRIETKL